MTIKTLTLGEAIGIAAAAHEGQMDINNKIPYIEHPLAVMMMVDSIDAKIVAVLHDCLEDTSVTVDYLHAQGATREQIDALWHLTRQQDEPYVAYVVRALAHPLARIVKIADYDHNTNPARMALLPPEIAQRLRQKYQSVASIINRSRSAPY